MRRTGSSSIGRLLALAALLAGLSLLISSQPASGGAPEPYAIEVTILSDAVRAAVEEHTSKPAASDRGGGVFRYITGPIRLKISFPHAPRSQIDLEEGDFSVNNSGSVDNLALPDMRDTTEWTMDLIPRNQFYRPITLSMPANTICYSATIRRQQTQVCNLTLSETFHYSIDTPIPLWMGFLSPEAYTQNDNNPAHEASFRSGQDIELAVLYSENMKVIGTPNLLFHIAGQEFRANYHRGRGTPVLVFKYTLQQGDPTSGILGLSRNLGVQTGAHQPVALNDGYLSPDSYSLPPIVERVSQLAPLTVAGAVAPRHMVGGVVEWEVHYSADLNVTDQGPKPFMVFTVTKPDGNEEQVQAAYHGRKAGSDDTLIFRYTIPADTVAPDSDFTLYNRRLVVPGGGFGLFGVALGIRDVLVNTLLPAVDKIFVAEAQLREGESVVYPVAQRAAAADTLDLIFASSGPSVAVSPDTVDFGTQPTADVTITAVQDADGDDEAEVTIDGAYQRGGGSIYLLHALLKATVLDDDPAINALTPPADAVDAGDPVVFQVTTRSAPVSGREITATISESGPDGSCIEAGMLTDVDSETAGIQIHVPISDTAGGSVPISVPTSLVFIGECTITASITVPAEVADERFFVLTDSNGVDLGANAALTASATVDGLERGPELPTSVFPSDMALQLSLDGSDAVVTPGESFNVIAALTYSGGRYRPQIDAATRLRLPNAYFWENSGRHTLSFSGAAARCSFRIVDGASSWTCPLALPEAGAAAVRIPSTAAPGRFTIVGSVTIDGKTYSGSLEVEVRDWVDEVAAVTFGPAAQTGGDAAGKPYPTSILSGQSTKLQLRILNENKAASDPDSIAAINFHTNAGSLSATLGSGGSAAAIGCAAGGLSCQIPVGDLTLSNVDSIILTVAHPGPGKLGEAQVRAAVVDTEGESFLTDPVAVSFLGGGETLTISEPRSGLYYQDTADEGADQDNRDLLTLSVSAADAGGARVDAPDGIRRWTIKGPNDRTASGFSVAWPKGGETPILDASRNLQVEIDVDSSTPLPLGEYTLELQAGSLKAKQSFSVVSGAGSLTLIGPPTPPQVGETITITAELKDGSGRPVTDGTSVSWTSGSPSADAVLIQLSADTAAINGKAAARFFVIGRGSAYIRAESGDTADVLFTSIAGASASEAAAVDYSEFIRGCNPSSWLGEPISISTLYQSLENPSSIYYWTSSAWVRYGRHHAPGAPAHGRLIPGSTDFRIPTGGVISIIFTAEAPCPFPPPGE